MNEIEQRLHDADLKENADRQVEMLKALLELEKQHERL